MSAFIDQHDRLREYREQENPNLSLASILANHFDHARKRMFERYRRTLTPEVYEQLNWQIFLERNSQLLSIKDELTTIYDVDFTPLAGRTIKLRLYYSEEFYCIKTFIPRGKPTKFSNAWSDLLARRRKIRSDHRAAGSRNMNWTINPSQPAPVPQPPAPKTTLPASPESGVPKLTVANVAATADLLFDAIEGNQSVVTGALQKALGARLKVHSASLKAKLAPRTKTIDEVGFVEKVLDKPLSKVVGVTVPILGVRMNAGRIFRTSETPDHPLYGECTAFVQRNNILLRCVQSARGAPSFRVQRRQPAVGHQSPPPKPLARPEVAPKTAD